MAPEPGKHGVVVTLEDIYHAGLQTQANVAELSRTLDKMVPLSARLDAHAADIKEEQVLRAAGDAEEREARERVEKDLQVQISALREMFARVAWPLSAVMAVMAGALTKVLVG